MTQADWERVAGRKVPSVIPPKLSEGDAARQARVDRWELEQDNTDGVDDGPPGWEP